MQCAVSDEAAIRRANLRALCKTRGWTARDLHQRMQWARYTYWRDLIEDPKKSFGEKSARRIEEALDLGRGWLDEPDAAATHRYPKATEPPSAPPKPQPSAGPPAPPRNYTDRRAVSETDWATLQAVKGILTEEELNDIRTRYQRALEEAMEAIRGKGGKRGRE